MASLILPNGTLGAYTGSGYLEERIKFTYTDNSSYPPSVGTKILAYTSDIPTALKNPKALTFGSKTYDGSAAKTITASDLGAALATDLTAIDGRVTSVEGWFEVVNVGTAQSPEYALHAKSGYAIYSDSWISAGGAGTSGGGGGSTTLAGLTDVTLSSPANGDVLTYNGSTSKWVNTAMSSLLSGFVTISGAQTILGAKTFSTDLTVSANLIVGGRVTVNSLNSIDQSSQTMSLFNYGARASKTFNAYGTGISLRACDSNGDQVNILSVQSSQIVAGSSIIPNYVTGLNLGGNYSNQRWNTIYGVDANLSGGLTFKDSANTVSTGFLSFTAGYMILRTGANISNSYKQITFHETNGFYPEQSGVNLGANGANYRWANIYGVNANLSGDLTLAATSHIDIGPLRIEYDDTNKAIHITKVDSNDNNEYGLYCDGFVSAGGVQASS